MQPGTFDAVLATDVLYDIGWLPSLLRTASACLVDPKIRCSTVDGGGSGAGCGYVCLSHVPRACYNSTTHPPGPDLERHIIDEARHHGFELVDRGIVRPQDCPQPDIPPGALNYVRMSDLQQVGAAIIVFAKTRPFDEKWSQQEQRYSSSHSN
jgi:hypothetical protein